VGLCSGSGMYVEAVVATGLGVIALTLLRRFEDKDDQTIRRRVTVVFGEAAATSADLVAAINAAGGTVADLDYDKRFDDKKKVAVSLEVRLPASVALSRLIEVLESQAGVRRIHVHAVTQ
jgi:putative Mg2+ transporter-C (MgtC) family protein